jgi:cysteine desulfurase
MRFKDVYMDNGATTQIDAKVLKAMMPYFNNIYGNASSTHSFGQKAREALDKSRKIIAKSINAKSDNIVFTSGGTEANNFALKGIAFTNKKKGNHIITTKIEHKSTLNCCKWLERHGFKITYLGVDEKGFVNAKDLEKAITSKTILFSLIHGSNEIGTIQRLKEFGKICKEKNIYFHIDACQSLTKTDIDVKKFNLDLVTLNAHKIHGPKGVGALYIKKGTKIKEWQHGGGHEMGVRSGTENIHGIVGFAEAVKQGNKDKHVKYISKLRDRLIDSILEINDVKLNGPNGKERLCNNVNFCFEGVDSEVLGNYLDQKLVCSSTGSACSAKDTEPSYVLKAIGLSDKEAKSSLRFTLSRFNTEEEIDYVIKILKKLVKKLR